MNKLFTILFLSCLKATELIEKKLNFKLSFKEGLQLKVHKSMCDACAQYEKQSTLMDMWFSMSSKHDSLSDIDKTQVSELKENIIKKLSESGTKQGC